MRVIASIAVSADGFIDDNTSERLILSDDADWAQVYALRRSCDAVLVGAETIRRDNPSLKFAPLKVIVSGSGNIPPNARIFETGRVIIITNYGLRITDCALHPAPCDLISLKTITARNIIAELERQGVSRLLVEGGAKTMKMFFDEDCIDEFRQAVSPITVGEGVRCQVSDVRCQVSDLTVKCTKKVGKMTVSEYILHPDYDLIYLQQAINLSRQTPPRETAYSVGCVIVTALGERFTGFTHQSNPHNHAEEEAITAAIAAGADLRGATAYTSLEPCSQRASKPISCSELLIKYGFSRVVYAASEPDCFVHCEGAQMLRNAGVNVRQISELAPQVLHINQHIINH